MWRWLLLLSASMLLHANRETEERDRDSLRNGRDDAQLRAWDANTALLDLDDSGSRGFRMLQQVEVEDKNSAVAAGTLQWRRRVVELGRRHAGRERPPPYVTFQGRIAAVVVESDHTRLEVFDRDSGFAVAGYPLVGLNFDSEGLAFDDDWAVHVAALGNSMVVVFPRTTGARDGWVVIGFAWTGTEPSAALHETFRLELPSMEGGVGDVVLSACEVILIPATESWGHNSVVHRPDGACRTEVGTSGSFSTVPGPWRFSILDRDDAQVAVAVSYCRTKDIRRTGCLVREGWVFSARRTTRLWQVFAGNDTGAETLSIPDVGHVHAAHLGTSNAWASVNFSVGTAGAWLPGLIRVFLGGYEDCVEGVARFSMPLEDGRATAATRRATITSFRCPWERLAFAVSEVYVTLDLEAGLSFRFHDPDGRQEDKKFDIQTRGYRDILVAPSSDGGGRLVVSLETGHYFRVGDSPMRTYELEATSEFKNAVGHPPQATVFPDHRAFWAVTRDGVVRWTPRPSDRKTRNGDE